jgi:hypothetical protein
MPDFRRGADAVTAAQERAKNNTGSFRPFTPSLFWQVGDERYLLFLNPMTDIVVVDKYIDFVPVPTKGDRKQYEHVIARTDPSIGEDNDPMIDDWEADPKEKGIAVAVELEPTFEEVKGGRRRPTGFQVATTEYERRVRDDKGDLTDETETVVSPVVGFITQSPHNFFNLVTSYDAQRAPIEETPLSITRVDSKTYTVEGFPEQNIDLADLVEYIDGVSWLGDDLDALLEQVDATESDEEAAAIIGAFFLDKRLAELVDEERYTELYEGIDAPFRKFGSDKGKKGGDKKERSKRERPARRSQRRSAQPDAEPEAGEFAKNGITTNTEPEPEEKPARQRRSRAKKEEAAVRETKAEKEAEEPKAESAARKAGSNEKLERLRARAEKRRAGAAA